MTIPNNMVLSVQPSVSRKALCLRSSGFLLSLIARALCRVLTRRDETIIGRKWAGSTAFAFFDIRAIRDCNSLWAKFPQYNMTLSILARTSDGILLSIFYSCWEVIPSGPIAFLFDGIDLSTSRGLAGTHIPCSRRSASRSLTHLEIAAKAKML